MEGNASSNFDTSSSDWRGIGSRVYIRFLVVVGDGIRGSVLEF